VAFGVGGVGLIVGTVFALQESSKESKANDVCKPTCADQSAVSRAESLDNDARSARTLSIVGFVAGGVGVAAGVTLLVLSGHHQEKATTSMVTPWVGPGSAGVSGRF
jgi:hypothetical protein